MLALVTSLTSLILSTTLHPTLRSLQPTEASATQGAAALPLSLRGGGKLLEGTSFKNCCDIELPTTLEVTQFASALWIANGAWSMISPKTNAEYSGLECSLDTLQESMWRWMGASQMVQGATWLVGVQKNETDLAAIVALTGCALSKMASLPGWEKLPIPKEKVVSWIILLAGLGMASKEKLIDRDVGTKAAVVIFGLAGAANFFFPQWCLEDVYETPAAKITNLGKHLYGGAGLHWIATSIYLGTFKQTGSHAQAIAASLGSLALGGVKNACEASGVGIMRAVPIAWSLVSAGLSGIAAANEVRCKNKDDKAKSAKSGLGLGK